MLRKVLSCAELSQCSPNNCEWYSSNYSEKFTWEIYRNMSQYMHYLRSKQNMWQHLSHDTILTQKLLTESNGIGRLTHWFRTWPKLSNVICSSKWRLCDGWANQNVFALNFLANFRSIFPFYTPWKHKISCFQGV